MDAINIPFKKTGEGVVFNVKVEPRSSRREIIGVAGDTLRVKLTSAPVGGKANEELIELLSETLKVRKSAIRILKGASSKRKLLMVEGVERL